MEDATKTIPQSQDHSSTPTVPRPPWAWIKAVHDILSKPPFTDPEQLPIQLMPWLYISDEAHSIRQVDRLCELQITHVLSMNLWQGAYQQSIHDRLTKCKIGHKCIVAKDEEGYDLIGKHWETEAKPFLLAAKNHPDGKMVVYRVSGTNRSGLVVAAAMLLLDEDGQRRDLLDVVQDLKGKRHMVLTNLSFQRQLCELAALYDRLGNLPAGYSSEEPNKRLKSCKFSGAFWAERLS